MFLTLMIANGCGPVRTYATLAAERALGARPAGSVVVLAAGDVARCDALGDDSTATLIDSILRADSAAGLEDFVAAIGDLAYDSGTQDEYDECWGASWGASSLIKSRIRPAAGNHDYETPGAGPYFRTFGALAGDPGRGYYAYEAGYWRVIVLNSEILFNQEFSEEDRIAQEQWLSSELRDHAARCTMAYYHRPLLSSGFHGGTSEMLSLFSMLYSEGVEVVVAGHEHHYERFAPMSPTGLVDSTNGVTQFVVGTGGATLRRLIRPLAQSRYQIQGRWGILRLVLSKDAWQSDFIDAGGAVWDHAGGSCH
jgi:hypothetical protein